MSWGFWGAAPSRGPSHARRRSQRARRGPRRGPDPHHGTLDTPAHARGGPRTSGDPRTRPPAMDAGSVPRSPASPVARTRRTPGLPSPGTFPRARYRRGSTSMTSTRAASRSCSAGSPTPGTRRARPRSGSTGCSSWYGWRTTA